MLVEYIKSLVKRYCISFALFGSLLCLPLQLNAALDEYQLKAVFLLNFTLFVSWPPNYVENMSSYNICILGDDPFGKVLDITIEGQLIDEKPVQIKRINKTNDFPDCHIVYISESEKNNFSKIIASLKNQPILTVSDIEDSAIKGGIVEFVKKRKKLRLNINPENANQAGIKIKANLYSLATIVSDK